MRTKFVYSYSVKIHISGFNKHLESIFCLLLVVEAFSLQKVVEMLEEVVVSWREVRWKWQMRQNFVVQFIQLFKYWLCNVGVGIIMEKNSPFCWPKLAIGTAVFSASHICWACFSDVMVSLGFIKLYCFRAAADPQKLTMTCSGVSWTLGSALELLLGPTTELVVT